MIEISVTEEVKEILDTVLKYSSKGTTYSELIKSWHDEMHFWRSSTISDADFGRRG